MVADLAPSNIALSVAIEGFVERLDEHGVEGWVIDRRDPGATLTIELLAGTRLLGTARTILDRPDVCVALGTEGRPGFRFDADIRDAILAAAADGLAEDLTLHVAGEPAGTALPGATRNLEIVRLGLLGDAPVTHDVLIERLAIHARTATRALDRPLSPLPEKATGIIEAVSIDESGLVWITGWITEDDVFDRPVFILEDRKHAAGMAYALVRRNDLPQGTVAFVGVLQGDWQPTSAAAPYLLMADNGERLLEPLLPTPVRTRDAIAPLIAHYLAHSEGPYRDLLRGLFDRAPQWTVPADRSAADLLQVDEVAILPGFGAFVTGWALSPTKHAEGFTIKLVNQTIAADPRSISHHDRPDLVAVYPTMGDAIGGAGFIAVFRGAFDDRRIDELIVKVVWSDGSSTNDRAIPSTTRILGLTAPLDMAYRFYPGLEAEHFFAEFARHAATYASAQAGDVQPYEVQPAPHVVILVAPRTSSDLFLMIDNALRHAAALPPTWGIAIIAESDHLRPLIVSLFADLKRDTQRPCSLLFTRRGRPSTDAIETLAQVLDAERFAFVDEGVALTSAGWSAIARAGPGLTLLAVDDPAAPTLAAGIGFDAFVADRLTWQALAADAAPRIGGIALPAAAEHRLAQGAAHSLGHRFTSPLTSRINQAIGHLHG